MSVSKENCYHIRAARIAEIPDILAIFSDEVKAGRMLPRSVEEMQADIDSWRVALINDQIIGCVSLVFFNEILSEIRSLAVAESFRQNGLGKQLIEAAVALAKQNGAKYILTLTRSPWLFEHFGFEQENIENFHEKVQQDCKLCPLLTCCDETALLYKIKESVPV